MVDDAYNQDAEAPSNSKFVHKTGHALPDTDWYLQYTELQLFNQLRYFVYLFNGEKAKKSASGSSDKGKPTYPMHNCD